MAGAAVHLRYLRYFVAVGETRNLSRAAAQLHVAQPALSRQIRDRKSTRLNSSHSQISYAVFCLKKKKKNLALDVQLIDKKHIPDEFHNPIVPATANLYCITKFVHNRMVDTGCYTHNAQTHQRY